MTPRSGCATPLHPARRQPERRVGHVNRNSIVTMLLGGLGVNGAAWTFVVWGAILAARSPSSSTRSHASRARTAIAPKPEPCAASRPRVLTFPSCVSRCVFFRAETFTAWVILTGSSSLGDPTPPHHRWRGARDRVRRLMQYNPEQPIDRARSWFSRCRPVGRWAS